jgi:hypothetical protein
MSAHRGAGMSLSPEDDPRTWLLPGPRKVKRPPLSARLLYYDLTTTECALLRAMCEECSDGSLCYASHGTYALTSGLSVKTIWDLIHGRNYIDRRPPGFIGPMNARHAPGLIERRILIQLTPVKKPSRRLRRWHTDPAMYSINEAALSLKPEILADLEAGVQQAIPGIYPLPRPGEPAPEQSAPGAGCYHDHGTKSQYSRHLVPDHAARSAEHPALGADNSRAFDSRSLDSKAGKHHAFGALTAHWIEIKTELQKQLSHEDYDQFIRPMYLFRAFGDALGLTLPPNNRIIDRAKHCELLQELVRARGYSGALIGRYPTDDDLIELQHRHPGIEESWGKTLRKRCEDAIERRCQEDARDSGHMRAETFVGKPGK